MNGLPSLFIGGQTSNSTRYATTGSERHNVGTLIRLAGRSQAICGDVAPVTSVQAWAALALGEQKSIYTAAAAAHLGRALHIQILCGIHT